MASNSKRISELSACTSPAGNNLLVLVGNTAGTKNTYSLQISDMFGNSSANVIVGNNYYLSANVLLIRDVRTPANSASLGFSNRAMWFDDNFIYCVTTGGVIKRAALSTF